MADFNPDVDYLAELDKSDKYEENGKYYPYLRGLKKLAHKHRKGIAAIRSHIAKAPSVNISGTAKSEAPDCIAAVTVTYEFKDGSVFEGSADASYKAHKAPFNLHLVAIAESKAEARAIRRAFNIQQVAKEEMGLEDDDNRDNEPITDTQIQGIRKNAKRKRLSQAEVLQMVGRTDIEKIEQLTYGEAQKALRLVNKAKPKVADAPAS